MSPGPRGVESPLGPSARQRASAESKTSSSLSAPSHRAATRASSASAPQTRHVLATAEPGTSAPSFAPCETTSRTSARTCQPRSS
jgi:hypothetical protein